MMKINHKTNTITIKLTKKHFNLKQIKGLTKKQQERLKKLVKNEIKMIKKHFKDDGWDLDFDIIRSDIISDLIGADFFGVISAEILTALKEKIELIHEDKFMLRDPNYQPIYMNKKTGKLLVAENSKEGRKFLIDPDYVNIGAL